MVGHFCQLSAGHFCQLSTVGQNRPQTLRTLNCDHSASSTPVIYHLIERV
jgi:hypothetical protein